MNKFEYFYNNSAITVEGCVHSKENMEFLTNWLKEYNANKSDVLHFHWIKGSEMNEYYGFTGDNAYYDALNIAVIEPMDVDLSAIILSRLDMRVRHFDDIVDDNMFKQNVINNTKLIERK